MPVQPITPPKLTQKQWFGAVAALVFLLDFLSKWAISQYLPLQHSWPVLPGVLHLTHVQNSGAAFSLMSGHPTFLTGFSLLFSVAFTLWAFRVLKQQPCHNALQHSALQPIALGAVLGGAVGNLFNRLVLSGKVTDFIDVTILHYAIFNLADAAICLGIATLLWLQFRLK